MTLDRLHQVMQRVMPWTDSHMHQFIAGRTYYGTPDPEMEMPDPETLSEKRFTLADLAPEAKSKFIYEYDFGDSWEHEVRVEKVLPPDAAFRHPICAGGANACPPDDCGGLGGYYDMLDDPKNPEHEELTEWVGGPWDAGKFDLAATNQRLKSLSA
jgi:hypothetical protein